MDPYAIDVVTARLIRKDKAARFGQRIDNLIGSAHARHGCNLFNTASYFNMTMDDIAFIVDPQKLLQPGWDTPAPRRRRQSKSGQ